MILFWLLASLLLVIATAVILKTLLLPNKTKQPNIEENVDLYQQRLREIESDLENNLLSEADAEKVRNEAEKALIIKDHSDDTNKKICSPLLSTRTTAIFLTFFLPVFVISIYQSLGEPALIKQTKLISEFKQAETDEEKKASIDKLLAQLEDRVVDEPDNVSSWTMLANSYTAMERFPDALRAIENVYRLAPDDFTVQLRYAEILSNTNGTLKGKATELIDEALQHAPDNPNALWLAGMAANERGDFQQVIDYWEQLLPQMEENSGAKEQLQLMINSIKTGLGQELTAADNFDEDAINNAIKLKIYVSLAAELEEHVNPDDVLFVYARAIEGPPMPLAIVRKTVKDLPLQITLDDSTSIMSSNKLSHYEQVQIIARISKTGNAIQQSGDLIGTLTNIHTNHNEILELTIYDKIE